MPQWLPALPAGGARGGAAWQTLPGRRITLERYAEVKKVIEKKGREPREEEVVRVLIESLADAPFRWRLRALPESINQQPGYGIAGSEIRYTPPDERRATSDERRATSDERRATSDGRSRRSRERCGPWAST